MIRDNALFPTGGIILRLFMVVVIFELFLIGPRSSEAAFATNDLEGTWEILALTNLGQANDPCINRRSLTFNAQGRITQASGTDCDNMVQSLDLNGAGSLDADGTFSMSYTDSAGVVTTIPHGTMDISKTKVALIVNDSDGYLGLATAYKKTGGFSVDDITGSWDLFFYLNLKVKPGFPIDIASNPTRSWGQMTINSAGMIEGIFENDLLGVRSFTGTGAITSTGQISAELEDSDNDPIVLKGQVDNAHTFASLVGSHDVGLDDIGVEVVIPVGLMSLVKTGFSFRQPELMGSWNFYSFNESSSNNVSCWERGTLNLDDAGLVESGRIVRCDGTSASATGGTLSITNNGSLSGAVTFDSGTIGTATRLSITHGQVDRQKTQATGINVVERGSNVRGMIVLVKNGDNFVGQLDINGDGLVTVFQDGMLTLRYLFGIRGQALLQGINVFNQSDFLTSGEIESNLAQLRTTMLDPDCNGKNTVFTDGLQIFRYLLGLRGENLARGIVDRSGCRTDPDDIAKFLNTFLPSSESQTSVRSTSRF